MKISYILILLALTLITSCGNKTTTAKKPTKIIAGTFCVSWLGDGINDKIDRNDVDCERIAEIIKNAKLDLVAIQQVENSAAIERIMIYLKDYQFVLGNSSGSQKLAFIYKKDLQLKLAGDLQLPSEDKDKARPGLITKLEFGKKTFFFLNVHLKDNSNTFEEDSFTSVGFRTRFKQNEKISQWCDSIEKVDPEYRIIIMGDFSDNLNKKTSSLEPLSSKKSYEVITKELLFSNKIPDKHNDNIILNAPALRHYEFASARVYDFYSALDFEIAKKISFHCPIIFTINIKEKLD